MATQCTLELFRRINDKFYVFFNEIEDESKKTRRKKSKVSEDSKALKFPKAHFLEIPAFSGIIKNTFINRDTYDFPDEFASEKFSFTKNNDSYQLENDSLVKLESLMSNICLLDSVKFVNGKNLFYFKQCINKKDNFITLPDSVEGSTFNFNGINLEDLPSELRGKSFEFEIVDNEFRLKEASLEKFIFLLDISVLDKL